MVDNKVAVGRAGALGSAIGARPPPVSLPLKPQPPVSVIIPTFNRRPLLGQSLDSVAHQTFTAFDVIVVDDGSTDGTADLVARHPLAARIRYLSQSRQGPAASRNRGLRHSSAPLVAFLDSDDVWRPTFLERTVALLHRRPELAMAYSDFVTISSDGRLLHGHRKRPHAGRTTAQLFASVFIHTSCVVARRAAVLAVGGFDPNLPCCEDYELWLRLSLRHPFGLVEEPLCLRRAHQPSLSRSQRADRLSTKARVLEGFYEEVNGNGQELLDRRLAGRRLHHVFYQAGRAHLAQGCVERAREMLRKAASYRRVALRSRALLLLASALPDHNHCSG